jgi:hypothetical protein
MNRYYGYGYAHPYVGQAPALDPNFPLISAINNVFYTSHGRLPTAMEALDFAFGAVLDGYGDAFAQAAIAAGASRTDRAALLRLVKQQISAHIRPMLSRSGL